MDQQRLALGQTAAVEHVAPDGEVGFGQAGGFDVGKAARNRQALGRGRDAVFGIAAARHQRADLVADRQAAGSRVAGHDFTGHFQAGQVRRAARRIGALALEYIGTVDAGRADLDQHLADRAPAWVVPPAPARPDRRGGRFQQPSSCLLGSKWIIIAPFGWHASHRRQNVCLAIGAVPTPGSVAERLKAPVLKTGKGLRPSWVRIPPLPPTRCRAWPIPSLPSATRRLRTARGACRQHDEESGKVYEMWMLDTALPFDAAVAALSEFAQRHFGGQKESRHQAAGRAQLGRELDPGRPGSLGATHLRGRRQRGLSAQCLPLHVVARPAGTPCPCPSGRHSGSSASGMTHSNSAHSG